MARSSLRVEPQPPVVGPRCGRVEAEDWARVPDADIPGCYSHLSESLFLSRVAGARKLESYTRWHQSLIKSVLRGIRVLEDGDELCSSRASSSNFKLSILLN